jgi:hypothetical protein
MFCGCNIVKIDESTMLLGKIYSKSLKYFDVSCLVIYELIIGKA